MASGAFVWLSTTKMLMRDVAGSAIGTFGVSRDITRSKLAEEEIRKAKDELEQRVAERTSELAAAYRRLELELAERERAQKEERETEVRFRFLFANNPLPMWVYETDTSRFLEVNDAAVRRYGYSAEQFTSMCVSDIECEDRLNAADAPESKHRLKNGHIIEVHITKHPMEWRGHNAVLVIAQDITEQKRLQRELIQSQKLEAVGTLAAGIAHDFNNLLTVVNGHCSLVQEQLTEKDPLYTDIWEINKAGDRAAALTRQLLAFSRKQIFEPRIFNLNATVADIDRMLRRLIGEDIELVTRLEPALSLVKADPGQIEQVIVNLAVNARDAMPQGGQLTITTSNVTSEMDDDQGPSSGGQVLLTVSDNGVGMDTETQARVFEPFFTTKPPGKGTGLGLSTVYGIVEQSGGTIRVSSQLGRGTTFRIYLPLATGSLEAPPVSAPSSLRASADETILLVEDEPQVRSLARAMLTRYGYRVLEAGSVEEALEAVRNHTDAIDLLVTDMVMPQMSGAELYQKIKALRSSTRVLFMSGYAEGADDRIALTSGMPFLQKPFSAAALDRKVREALHS